MCRHKIGIQEGYLMQEMNAVNGRKSGGRKLLKSDEEGATEREFEKETVAIEIFAIIKVVLRHTLCNVKN